MKIITRKASIKTAVAGVLAIVFVLGGLAAYAEGPFPGPDTTNTTTSVTTTTDSTRTITVCRVFTYSDHHVTSSPCPAPTTVTVTQTDVQNATVTVTVTGAAPPAFYDAYSNGLPIIQPGHNDGRCYSNKDYNSLTETFPNVSGVPDDNCP